jgi:hypothetical protein
MHSGKPASKSPHLKLSLLALATFGMLVAAPVAASSPGTLDQSQTASDGSEGFCGSGGPNPEGQIIAQTFTAGITGQLDQIDLLLAKEALFGASPGDVTVQIRAASDGVPSATILASELIAEENVPLFSFAWISVPINPAPSVSVGGQYAIVLLAPNAVCGSECYLTSDATADPYAGGREFASQDSGVTWTPIIGGDLLDRDMTFKTYVTPSIPTSKAQCKAGGWRNFPQFKNEGECISFVNH